MKKLLGFCFATMLLGALSAAAQNFVPPTENLPSGPATIAGKVTSAQAAVPVADTEIVLYALQRNGAPSVARTTTDAQGLFAFDKLSNAPDVTYLVGAQYQGVPFPGERVQFTEGQTRHDATIQITEVREQLSPRDKPLRNVESTIQFERSGQHLKVAESHQLLNENSFTVFAPEPHSSATLFHTRLPSQATSFAMPYGVIPEGVDQTDQDLGFRGPLYPGKQEFSFSYEIPAHEAEVRFARRFSSATEKLVVLLPQTGFDLQSTALQARGVTQVGPHTLHRFESGAVAAGKEIVLALTTPVARHDPQALQLDEVRLVSSRDGIVLYNNEEYFLHVDGNEPITGTIDTPLFRIRLPEHASDIHFGDDTANWGLNIAPDGTLLLQGPLPPGDSRLGISYSLPLATGSTAIARKFEHAIPIFSFYLEDTGILVTAERLHRRRPVASEESIYQYFEGFQLQAGEELSLRLAPLVRPQPIATWIAPSVAFTVLAFTLAGLFLPLRSREAIFATAESAPSEERQKRELVYTAIRDLDEDYQTGKIEEALYHSSREELLARAGALLVEERSAPHPAAATAWLAQCPSCSTPASDNARFCAQCGAALHKTNASDTETSKDKTT